MNARLIRRILPLLLLLPLAAYAETSTSSLPGTDWMKTLTDNIDALTTANSDLFVGMGNWELGVFTFFGFIGIVLRWQQTRLARVHHSNEAMIGDLYFFVISVLLFGCALTYYSNPLPGSSLSLHQVPSYFSGQITLALQGQVVAQTVNQVALVWKNLNKPSGITDIVGALVYLGVLLDMMVVSICMFVVDAFGLLMVGVLTLWGPVFIPFGITRRYSKWCWGWWEQLIAFSMYRAVAQGVITIWAGVFFGFFTNTVNGDYSLGAWLTLLASLVPLTAAFAFAIFKIPTITSALFSGAGSAGQDFASSIQAGLTQFLTRI